MRAALAISLGALCLAGWAWAQDDGFRYGGRQYSVGPARIVCGECDQVIWSPDGRDLAYSRRDGSASEIGLFDLKRDRGGTVALLAADERLAQIAWLRSGRKALIVTRRAIADRQPPAESVAIRIGDADRLNSKELWSSELPIGASIDVEVSPTLEHAILSVTAGSLRRILVLTSNANAIVESADLEAAARQGQEIAGWSVDGTAVLSPESGPTRLTSADSVLIDRRGGTARAEIVTGQIVLQFNMVKARADLPVGATTLECVPANGVLRQVRFPGYFQAATLPSPVLTTRIEPEEHRLAASRAHTACLWLVSTTEKNPAGGLFVSGQAESAWLSPSGEAIAFTCHGALFVRHIASKRAD